jgi:hypothetical protein
VEASSSSDESTAPAPARRIARLWHGLQQNARFRLLRRFYRRHENLGPPLFFFGGVTWDALTLRRIDAWFDNIFLLGYLALLGLAIMAALLHQNGRLRSARLRTYSSWFAPAIQFLAGALFSAYVIYYSQSVSWATSAFWVFLVVLLVANEFLQRIAFNAYVLLGFYFLSALTFFIFFLPVLTGTLGYATFLASGGLSLALIGAMIGYLRYRAVFRGMRMAALSVLVLGLFGIVHLLYVQNWIPPVPLALRAGGAYHHVETTPEGYRLTYEPRPWDERLGLDTPVLHRAEGDTVFCFAAVFAPTTLETPIIHHWQFFDAEENRWQTTDRIRYTVTGGRYNGYRGYTFKRRTWDGRWRVDVETPEGLLLGRIPFRLQTTTDSIATRQRLYR